MAHPGGAPSKQPTVDLEMVKKLADAGLTNDQLAVALNVSTSTVKNWKSPKNETFWPEFLTAIKSGKSLSDDKVERSLWERAIGYEHEDVHITAYEGDVTETPIVKHYPPDTAAAFIWLKNRRPEKWRDRREIGVDGNTVSVKITAGEGLEGETIAKDLEDMA